MNTRHLTLAFNAEFGMDKAESAIRTVLNRFKITCGRIGNERLVEVRQNLLTKTRP